MAINKRIIKSNDEGGVVSADNFAPVTYIGNGGTQSISSLDFQPDLVWIKHRESGYDHFLYDSIRGGSKHLIPNSPQEERSGNSLTISFNSNGFTLAGDNAINHNGFDFVAWCWKAGGAAVSNTDGTITSQVSANVDAGFSIVSYTGNGIANSTIGHGLGVKPDIVLVKSRSAANSWQLYSTAISTATYPTLNGRLHLENTMVALFDNYTVELADNTFKWTGSASTFPYFNYNNITYVAYCFRSVDGYQKVGSYTGNGSNTGPVVTTGFQPRFLLIKNASEAFSWMIHDSARDTSNPRKKYLLPNASNQEAADLNGINFNLDGFQILDDYPFYNKINNTYIYLAIA